MVIDINNKIFYGDSIPLDTLAIIATALKDFDFQTIKKGIELKSLIKTILNKKVLKNTGSKKLVNAITYPS